MGVTRIAFIPFSTLGEDDDMIWSKSIPNSTDADLRQVHLFVCDSTSIQHRFRSRIADGLGEERGDLVQLLLLPLIVLGRRRPWDGVADPSLVTILAEKEGGSIHRNFSFSHFQVAVQIKNSQ